jgi:GT2 family glycosyltransferase
MDHSPSVGLAGPRILNPDGTVQPSSKEFPTIRRYLLEALAVHASARVFFLRNSSIGWQTLDTSRNVDVLKGCFWMVRRKALDEVGLLDERFYIYGEDIDWCGRFRKEGWHIAYFNEAEAIHFGEASSTRAPTRFYVEMFKARLQYVQKHRGTVPAICTWVITLIHQAVRLLPCALHYMTSPDNREETRSKIDGYIACIGWLFHGILTQNSHGRRS